jgi:hypothetical protein
MIAAIAFNASMIVLLKGGEQHGDGEIPLSIRTKVAA